MLTRNAFKTTALCLIFFALTLASAMAQPAGSANNLGTAGEEGPQLQFVGQEPYDVNGTTGMRYKLSVTNRSTHPDFLWTRTAKPCGKNENASRTWVEVFGSPGDKRLAGFCALRSSEDLGHLWFPVEAGEKGPQCVYLVMTDQETGKKYESNRTCSRSFTVVRGRLSAGAQQPAPARDHGWIEAGSFQTPGTAENNAQSGSRAKPLKFYPLPHPIRLLDTKPDSSEPGGKTSNQLTGERVNHIVRRGQMAAFLVRAFGTSNPPTPASQRFADVPPSNPFYAYIDRVAELGIVQGCGRNKFCPGEPVRREQMAAFIIRALGTSNPPAPAAQRFADVPPVSPFYAFIDLAASRKLIAGCGGNNFCPKEPVTRDEAAAALRKAFPSKSNSSGLKGGGQSEVPTEDRMGNFEIQRMMSHSNENEPKAANGNRPKVALTSVAIDRGDSKSPANKRASMAQPDLRIRQFLFPTTNDKALRVHVVNTGKSPSAACRLVLIVRKINGNAAGRTTHVNVPALAAGTGDWLHIDVKSILPNNVSLQSTTFKLKVDGTEIVAEGNETNNEVWHNQ